MNDNLKVFGVFLDVAKAFDSLDQKIQLRKMSGLGVSGGVLNWFKFYFSDRDQILTIDNVDSDPELIEYGMIQGSTLGPFLFLVYINDLTEQKTDNASIILFADDTVIHRHYMDRNRVDCERTFKESIKLVQIDHIGGKHCQNKMYEIFNLAIIPSNKHCFT